MPLRPHIPADIKRQVLKESGHRCSVCGAESPLEFAHITPWNKCKTHEAKNLVVLCASCHQRADLERWGAKMLRQYKHEPWVRLQRTKAPKLSRNVTKDVWTGNHRIEITSYSKRLRQDIAALKVSSDLKKSVYEVLVQPDYPLWMSISGTLYRNPIWKGVSSARRCKVAHEHRPDGPTAPKLMHLDILLTRCSDKTGRAYIDTYYSPDWSAYLFPFRPWLAEDDSSSRKELNAAHLAKYWRVPANTIDVKPLSGKYAVSAKLHAKHQDLILYVFEFCSVVFHKLPSTQRPVVSRRIAERRWFDLHVLRQNPRASAVNGDVMRAMNELFSVNLRSLPNSLPSKFLQRGEV